MLYDGRASAMSHRAELRIETRSCRRKRYELKTGGKLAMARNQAKEKKRKETSKREVIVHLRTHRLEACNNEPL